MQSKVLNLFTHLYLFNNSGGENYFKSYTHSNILIFIFNLFFFNKYSIFTPSLIIK